MKTKKIIRVAVASLLVLACALTFFACRKKNNEENVYNGKLPNQYGNQRYYFDQGYLNEWGLKEYNKNERALNNETGLIVVFAPVASSEKVEVDGKEVTQQTFVQDVEYCVYFVDGVETGDIYMTTSTADIVERLTNEDDSRCFNNKHFREAPRDTFHQNGAPEKTTAKYSKLQYQTVAYTFVKDGVDWNGIYNVFMKGQEYFVVTYEARADIFEQYRSDYNEMIGDLRKKGWEHSD